MPIISQIGRRSRRVRAAIALLYAVLILGALTMAYPFLLMMSGSTASDTDIVHISPLPRFWFDDTVLLQKYVESKHNAVLGAAEDAWSTRLGTWRNIAPCAPADRDGLDDYLTWRVQCPLWNLGHASGSRMLPANARLFRARMFDRCHGDLDAYRRAMGVPVATWNAVLPPPPVPGRYPAKPDLLRDAYAAFARERPVSDRVLFSLDGHYLRYLTRQYPGTIREYNQAHGTVYARYEEILLDDRAPREEDVTPDVRSARIATVRADWEEYVRTIAPLSCVRLDPSATPDYRRFLAGTRHRDIAALNAHYGRAVADAYASFDVVPLPATVPQPPLETVDWAAFLADRKACPLAAIAVYGPRQAFRAFAAQRRGVPEASLRDIRLPLRAADDYDCRAHARALRWEFTTRNYRHVFQYILRHGRGVRNTLIYCLLAIVTALVVNPLAAYALSRHRPPSTYTVLLFCMATMAFPGEVTMIPSFLLLKHFPLWPIAGGLAACLGAAWLAGRLWPRAPESRRLLAALAAGILAGAWALPLLLPGHGCISLLNTFAALILPGMANGYSIFLLKGFFDSLPRELFEAAELDGAGEWTKFWHLTMGLSKPILAVLALGAFTAAYSAFMIALIIIPDPEMWTLMVWIFQLQTDAHQSVVYASLVIAALPTFLVFAFCQNIIIRGIVVPTEK